MLVSFPDQHSMGMRLQYMHHMIVHTNYDITMCMLCVCDVSNLY